MQVNSNTPDKDASSLSNSGMDSSTFYSINDSGKMM